ncbi:MAG: alpha/beta fold hydrolase [Alphaproteobacteria bacterium]
MPDTPFSAAPDPAPSASQTGGPGLPERPDHWFTLADGRRLAYRVQGPVDAPPVFYFHGWPGSRLEPGFFDLSAVRLIALDRPGYGQSSPQDARTLTDWAADVGALADGLGLRRFGIVGMSGGGPYAAACAHALGARVITCVLISALGPPEAPGMSSIRLSLLRALGKRPSTGTALFGMARRVLQSPKNDRYVVRLRKVIPRGDRDLEALDPAFLSHLLNSWREGTRASVAGMASDARVYGTPWPFKLEDISVPVRLWHGEADRIVPSTIAEHAHARLGDSVLKLYPEEGHISLIRIHLDTILEDLRRCMAGGEVTL